MRAQLLVAVLLVSIQAWTQPAAPEWSVNPSAFSNSMAVVGTVKFERTFSADINDQVAAIVNGEVRGMAHLQYEPLSDQYIAFLIIYGNQGGETITFQLYDADNGQIYESYKQVAFQINGLIGNLESPFIWSELVLNPEGVLNEITFREVHGDVIMGDTIEIPVRYRTDISWLAAEFDVSTRATVWVDDVEQKSGRTFNDFTNPVTYKVVSEDGQTTNRYIVKVVEAKRIVKAYPNPATHKVHIDSDDGDDISINFITIRDLAGRVLHKDVYIENNTLYVSDLKKGIYVLEFELFDQTISLKFVKK